MTPEQPQEEPLIPRLMATNALRANLNKHMDPNKMADAKASMIMTASSLVITITLTQYDKLALITTLLLAGCGLLAVVFSILAIIPPFHVSDHTNLFYFRSFSDLSEQEFKDQFRETITDRDKLYDLGKHRLTRKYGLIRNGLWTLLFGLLGATPSAIFLHLPV
ncbi:MAG: DUF5706 domain-containing protein [Deltaproteobacteria bacterium]|nr:DUF5706 domain-containing protein [Deltaproteobacteria bacterium]